jgi:hypothetical protein
MKMSLGMFALLGLLSLIPASQVQADDSWREVGAARIPQKFRNGCGHDRRGRSSLLLQTTANGGGRKKRLTRVFGRAPGSLGGTAASARCWSSNVVPSRSRGPNHLSRSMS